MPSRVRGMREFIGKFKREMTAKAGPKGVESSSAEYTEDRRPILRMNPRSYNYPLDIAPLHILTGLLDMHPRLTERREEDGIGERLTPKKSHKK
ncbi:Hypothetical protein NTJ_04855 [Nesidiocoris tenuis]|uniref:Uncharacterized protein n=1 Tax=Nesidiocoris tenuis TaxID=355587 RepID=A0ABN7AIF8_9HEMI|nr:Hypothetical protein NTJ_04855 [Nesidiocoris tenuis]